MKSNTPMKYLASLLDTNKTTYPWISKSGADARGYLELLKGKSSEFLWNRVDDDFPKTVLELGCNSGSRLFSRAINQPKSFFIGVDINKEALKVARSYALKNNIQNIDFIYADISKPQDIFHKLDNTKFDLIFTWATLIYIHPIRIENVIEEMMNHSKRLILIEQHNPQMRLFPKGIPISSGNNWVRNYQKLIAKHQAGNQTLLVSKVPSVIWQPGGGHAHLLELK